MNILAYYGHFQWGCIMLFVSILLAQAEARSFNIGGGIETVVNDPFFQSIGLSLDTGFRPQPWVMIGLSATVYKGEWTSLADWLIRNISVAPDISQIRWRLQPQIQIIPFSTELLGGRRTEVFVGTGIGIVRTQDDLVALQADNDPEALSTQNQIHPGYSWLVGGTFGGDVKVKAWIENFGYIETVMATTLERKSTLALGMGLQWHR